MDNAHQVALNKAKINLMSRPDSAFFTTLCFSLRHVWDETLPTAATDGTKILINPKFFMDLSAEERVFLLLHESMHVAYLHMLRLGTRDHAKWNAAADYVINLQLVDRGFAMPKDGLLDRQYAGMGTEEVYDALPQMQASQVPMLDLRSPPNDESGNVTTSPGKDSNGMTQAEVEAKLSEQVQDILVRAAIQSKQSGDKAGTIPGDIQIFLDGLLNPKLPWNQILRKFVRQLSKDDYSYRRPNRRFFPDYYLPSLYSQTLMDIVVAVDTSGSVSDAEFHRFVSEVASIFRMMKPKQITLLQFDTEIKSVEKIRSIPDLMRCRFSGRGGTQIDPAMQWIKSNKPQLALVFSDGYFRFGSDYADISTPLVWLIHAQDKFEAPIGKVIHYEV
jgi:predicted metal-dependent peptidase